jgi:putative transcriptional regulator
MTSLLDIHALFCNANLSVRQGDMRCSSRRVSARSNHIFNGIESGGCVDPSHRGPIHRQRNRRLHQNHRHAIPALVAVHARAVMEKPLKNRLRVLRAEQGWSQADLAKRLDISRQSVNAIETGKFDPSLPLAFKIARLFDSSIEIIFQEKAAP